jgi:hypothetical protein
MNVSGKRVLVLAAFLAVNGSILQAQATRTWVSGVGDDVNPCSRTAPCKTFAGAISKTAAGGQINVLDPGAYGALTITKSITVDASGHFAGVLATLGSSGIIVNAAASDIVVLRGLTIDGNGTGANGVRHLAGAALYIENCVIRSFRSASVGSGHGISFAPSGASELYVSDTVVTHNGTGTNGGGILIKPSGAGSASVVLDRVGIHNNVFGLQANGNGNTGGIKVTIRDSTSAGNSFAGITATTPGGGSVINLMVESSASVNNGTIGILSDGALSTVRISNATATGNGTGLQISNGAVLASHGNNRVGGNGTDGAPNQTPGEI